MSASSTTALTGRFAARTASIHIDPGCNAFLQDCFKTYGIHIVSLAGDPVTQLQRQKVEACLLRLYDPDAKKILEAARSSASNRRIVVYGIARNTKEALQHSSYGINAVLDEPLDRPSVMKVVRSTRVLVINELRRYARVPMVSRAVIETSSGSFPVMTAEISSGGLSVSSPATIPAKNAVTVSLTLPGGSRFSVRAVLCWERKNADKIYGLRFDSSDPTRLKIREWIDQQLEIV
ncbi:MAG TPA: PilZ domain-containing protein [Candidatus Angelobacter sp.]|nr:PilZ domain-containing protein [Candidatus Angelobacter sp.]